MSRPALAGRAALQTDWDSLTVGIVNFDLGSRNGQERESGFREALAGDPRVKDIYTINVNATPRRHRSARCSSLWSTRRSM